ncbi:amino acid adenylation domain-containing protein [Streptomyces sp. MST-110588]|uniref:amino acid adenylation domain-containing protein n=1 Tax=Streptomyces sp. MST-110588 TaxID=2833628 RepID=UPI001F5C1346|nr:amino acid adenylation domain-containing protein [Streptomyces sp. MST-110588]UNO43368.1 amino acid adenylation domain-containing protein [Streptomyces sp. MST-110588]
MTSAMQKLNCSQAALAVHREINRTSSPYPRECSLPERFEHWAARRPDAPAVLQGDRELSYRRLNRLANGLAHTLRDKGAGPGTTIGVCVARSPAMLVALLGILKAGATYVPLDPAWPDERLRYVLEDAGSTWVLGDRPAALAPRLDGAPCRVLPLDALTGEGEDTNPPCQAGPDSIACINFTSGSMGRPKGVPIFHRGIIRLVHGATYGPMNADSRVLQITPVTFDIATWEIWGALLNGGVSVLYPAEPIRLSVLDKVMKDGRVTITLLTTALFNLVVDEAPEALETVGTITSGGEAHSIRHMAKAVRTYGPGRVVNLYGPTECTCIGTFYPVDEPPREDAPLPIGKPIQNTRLYILDDTAERLCEPGESGEICLAGDGLAAGYLGLPELTRQHFIHRCVDGVPERLYRTGDRGHLLPGGDVVFDGRLDDQVKVNSYRIELGEITHHLNHSRTVKRSYVTVRDHHGERSLVAFVVPAGPGVTPESLRAHLAAKLPRYMVPSQIHLCDAFPLTPNGKVDGRALLGHFTDTQGACAP